VFESLKVTLAAFPLTVRVVALWKPLPRMVRVAPPVAGTVEGVIGADSKGTAAR